MKSHKLHFTIGAEFPQLLVKLAREYLYNNLDFSRAIEFLNDSLIGITSEESLSILLGENTLTISEENSLKIVKETGYCPDTLKWLLDKSFEIEDTSRDYINCIDSAADYLKGHNGTFTAQVSWKDILNNTFHLDYGDEQESLELVCQCIDMMKIYQSSVRVKMETLKRVAIIIDEFHMLPRFEMTERLFQHFKLFIETDFTDMPNCVKSIVTEWHEHRHDLDEQLQNLQELDPGTDLCAHPFDAGWISPYGKLYGIFGEYGDMLHMRIADRLKEMGFVDEKLREEHEPNDAYFSHNGWIRVHGDHVLFDGYNSTEPDEIIDMTEYQKDALLAYGKQAFNGKLRCGVLYKEVTMAQLYSMDKFALRKLFAFN